MVVQVSFESGERIREAVVTSGYFPGDNIRIPTELVVRLMKFCKRQELPFPTPITTSGEAELRPYI